LARRRPGAAPHRRPADRPAGERGLAHGLGRRLPVRGREHAHDGRPRARPPGSLLAAAARRAGPAGGPPRRGHRPRGVAAMTDALWYLARGAGLVSLVLLTVVVVLGIAGRSGRPAVGLPRFAVAMVHRNAGLLAVVMLGIHVIALLFDPYAQLRLV